MPIVRDMPVVWIRCICASNGSSFPQQDTLTAVTIMAKRLGLGPPLRLVVFLGLAACLTGFSWLLLAQDATPPGYRAYRLKHAKPSEVTPRLEQMLSEMGAEPEILVDQESSRILLRGTENDQKLAVELLETLDRPAASNGMAQDPKTPSVAKGYRVGVGSLHSAMAELRAKFPPSAGVRVAADERTGQLVVVAPEETHREIVALFGRANQSSSGSLAVRTTAGSGTPRQLKNITWRELEDGLGGIWGQRLSRSTNRDGELALISIIAGTDVQPVLQIDRRQNSVSYVGPAGLSQKWDRVLQTLDRPQGTDTEQMQLVALDRADPVKVHRAVSLMQLASRDNGARRDETLAVVFQPGAEPAPADAPAKTPTPAKNPPAAEPAGDAAADATTTDIVQDLEDGGLLGPVDIQLLDGLDVIILRGHKRDVERVRQIIEDIKRVSKETQPVIEVYKLNFVGCQVMSELVSEMYEEILSPRQGPVSIRPLLKPNALLLIGAPDSLEVVKKLIAKLDQPVDPDTQFEVFQLKNISAVDAEETIRAFFVDGLGEAQQAGQTTGSLRPGLGTRVNVVANYVSNSLIVQASPRDMAEVRRLIIQIDSHKTASANEVKIFRLKNALASDVAPVLQDALNWQLIGNRQPYGQSRTGTFGGTTFGGQQTQEQARLRSALLTFMTIDSDGGKVLVESGGPLSDVRISADMNTNALVVTGPAKGMKLIEALVNELDTLPNARAQIKVFTIVNGDAMALSGMLQQLLGEEAQTTQQGSTAFGQGSINPFLQPGLQTAAASKDSTLVPIRFAVDQRTNSIVVTGSEGDLGVVEAVLLRLDEDSYREHKTAVYWLANAPAVDVAEALNVWLDERASLFADQLNISPESPDIQWNRQVIVVPEINSNSIIISAAPELFDEVKHVVDSLDRSLPLIKIDVLIAEVALTDFFEFGAEFGIQDSLLFDRTYFGTAGGDPGAGLNFNNVPLGDQGIPGTLGAQALSAFGVGRVSPNEGYGGLVLSASKDSLSVLIRALQEDGRIQILSRPQVTTLDSQPATVFVGENTARPGGTSQNASTTTTAVNYEDVGLQILVTPRVTPDGTVVMEIDTTKSRIDDARSVTIDGNEIPNIVTVNAATTVCAASGQTVVFAGLIQTNKQEEVRGIPYVSRLPVVGPLLSYTEDREQRTELLIIMTPRVIRDNNEDDMGMIRYAESERMSWCLADVVDLYGDVGMSSRPGWWCDGEWHCRHATPVIFPHEDPAGIHADPVPQPMEVEDPDLPLPVLPSSRRTHQPSADSADHAAMGMAPMYSVPPEQHPHGAQRLMYPGMAAAYERPTNMGPEYRGYPGGPRDQAGPAHGGPQGGIQYEQAPNEYDARRRMPMTR